MVDHKISIQENDVPPAFIDASSAILLFKADLFTLCSQAFPLVMAEAVFDEITVQGYAGAEFFRTMKEKNRIKIQRPTRYTDIGYMDRGEQDTLAIFNQDLNRSSFIIIDDGRGAKYCRAQGIPFINALLVPRIFWYSGLMDKEDFEEKTRHLIALGRYSQKIIHMAQALSKKDLAHFMDIRKAQ